MTKMGATDTGWFGVVFKTGVADFFRYKNKPPVYWRESFEKYQWQAGWNHAQSCVGGGR